MNRTDMQQRMENHWRSFWQGDLDDFDEQLSADFIDNGNDNERGREPAKAFARSVRGGFPDMTVTVLQAIVENEWVAVRAQWNGTQTGTFLDREPTGRHVTVGGMVFCRFGDGGRIEERWSQIDFGSVFAQLDSPDA
jgi:predicted ester cyclase